MKHPNAKPIDADCPARDTLVEYSLGTLSRRDLQSVADHLASCDSCLGILQSLDDRTDALVLGLRQQEFGGALTESVNDGLVERLTSLILAGSTFQAQPEATLSGESRPGQIGPYQIIDQIGEGGMGKVYRALHVHLGRVVALKVLPSERLPDTGAVARFNREMQAVGRMNHPNIVQGLDAGVAGVPFLAMEFVEGMDLGRLVKARGPLPVPEACECVRQAALGLQHAHERGLVHRDMKPSNLMLTPEGVVKVLDLGLVRVAAEPAEPPGAVTEQHSVTNADTFLGTPGYIAPEQLRGAHAVDIRADLYGLGCTLYCLLVGRSPAVRSTPPEETLPVACMADLTPDIRDHRPEVPPKLASIIDQLLANDPDHRPDTPANLAASLLPFALGANPAALLGSNGVTTSQVVAEQQGQLVSRRQGLAPWLIGLATFVVVLSLLALFFYWPDEAHHPQTPDASAMLIDTLVVEQYRPQHAVLTRLGEVGATPLATPMHTDSYRVRVQLNEPAYCYLIAFGPDINGMLCFPGDSEEVPRRTQNVLYPSESHARLTKPGLYAFAILASRKPLPAYAAWRGGLPEFRSEQDAREGVWRFDGQKVVTLRGGPVGLHQPMIPPAIQDLSRSLSGHPACEAKILAFSVR